MASGIRMVEAVRASTNEIRQYYDRKSRTYDRMLVPLEEKARLRGLDQANLRPGDRVLEVAVGPGATLLEIARRVGPGTPVEGVDLSSGMLAKAREKVAATGLSNVSLREADARQLPFADGSFDVLYNSYMLDLIQLEEMDVVLGEFFRVLRPGGRLVLVNLSKRDPARITWFERLYRFLPDRWKTRLVGACRPVVMDGHVTAAGFTAVRREYIARPLPSEIVLAVKPERSDGAY